MGYGVPFVTRTNAITGGEIFNIENNINGFLYNNENDLLKIIEYTIIDRSNILEMGLKARDYYVNQASPEKMIEAVLEAIKYSLK